MGYYLPNDEPIVNKGAEHINKPDNFSDIPEDKALICEVDNSYFKANGLCYCKEEFEAFDSPSDRRPKKWFLMDKEKAHKLSNYKQNISA